jgi:two-component system response regulator HydG
VKREGAPRVLVVDDQLAMAEMVADGLAEHGIAADALSSGKEAVARLEAADVALIVTDLRMPDLDGLALLEASRRQDPERPVIVMTAYGAIDSAIEAMRRGAFHYLTKPFKLEELAIVVRRALDQIELRHEATRLREELRARGPGELVAESRAMREIVDVVARLAVADAPVLILGETGTGKGLLAETLHARGARAKAPFVAINCAAIPEPLLESELFGHVRGAFTGATADRDGLLVAANGGTLFLDEIGDLAPGLQAKLLHVLERGVVRPLGGSKERAVDVRIVAATNRDLHERAREGLFREDLLYRLDVVSFEVPPLRRRREDLPQLLELFFRRARAKHPSSTVQRIGQDAMRALLEHAWPGNVRELAHVLERVVLLARGPTIGEADLPPSVRGAVQGEARFEGDVVPMRKMQRRYAAWALDRLGGHRGRTAEALGIDPKTLSKLLGPEED